MKSVYSLSRSNTLPEHPSAYNEQELTHFSNINGTRAK